MPLLALIAFQRVGNTEQALAYLRTEPVDVMVCDESAGFDDLVFFIGNIRSAINSDPAVPILVITEGMSQGQDSALRDAGASDVICKPMSCEGFGGRWKRACLGQTLVRNESIGGTQAIRRRSSAPDRR